MKPSLLQPSLLKPTRRQCCATAALGAAISALFALSSMSGCNVGVPAAYAIFGPGKIEAMHELAPVRTVVFVDDRQNVLPRTSMRAAIGDKVSRDIMERSLVPSAVRPADAIILTRQREDGAKPLSIAAIGRELECQQVIYVQVTGFSLVGDGGNASGGISTGATPTATAVIKVIDVVNNIRTFPGSDGPGYDLVGKVREVDQDHINTVAKRRVVEDKLAIELGEQIGKLFYEYERIDFGENLGPR